MYRCGVCRSTSEPGQSRTTHVLRRADGSTCKELFTCKTCDMLLAGGMPLNLVLKQRAPAAQPPRPVGPAPGLSPTPTKPMPVSIGARVNSRPT